MLCRIKIIFKMFVCIWLIMLLIRTRGNLFLIRIRLIWIRGIRGHWRRCMMPCSGMGLMFYCWRKRLIRLLLRLWFLDCHIWGFNIARVNRKITEVTCVSNCWDLISFWINLESLFCWKLIILLHFRQIHRLISILRRIWSRIRWC